MNNSFAPSPSCKLLLTVLPWLSILCTAVRVNAEVMSVDPGPTGVRGSSMTIAFDDLNGTALVGQTLDFEFLFAAGKSIKPTVPYEPEEWSTTYNAQVRLFTSATTYPGLPSLPPSSGIYLVDETGSPIAERSGRGSSQSPDGSLAFSGSFDADDVDGLEHYGLQFLDVTLPVNPTVCITGASLRLFVMPCDDHTGTLEVLPEPSTTALLSAALLSGVIVACGRRKET